MDDSGMLRENLWILMHQIDEPPSGQEVLGVLYVVAFLHQQVDVVNRRQF
jgi:hypothetical protein